MNIFKRAFSKKQEDNEELLYLKNTKGLLHVGANFGQERFIYQKMNLNVIWVEPIPDVFAKLAENVKEMEHQHAFNYLCCEEDGKSYEFNISSNHGASSSILDFEAHKELWPDVEMVEKITIEGVTLDTMLRKEQVDMSGYDAMLIDTQGSELLVLQGAAETLSKMKYVQIEVADFESYKGCVQYDELVAWMAERGFQIHSRNKFKSKEGVGNYYDVVFERKVA